MNKPVRLFCYNGCTCKSQFLLRLTAPFPHPSAVHHQREEGGSGREAGDRWTGGGAEGSLLQPGLAGSLQEHS